MQSWLKFSRQYAAVFALTAGTAVAGCAPAISTQQEVQMGAQYASEINRQLPIVQNPQVHYYINQLGNTIARQADPRGIQYTFYVVNAPQVNAFAIPGGHIYVNRGLIDRASNLSELAGVLGHEIGHVVHRHGIEQMQRAQNAELGVNLAYILLGRQPSGVEQVGLQVGAGAFFARHSREAELEADRVAIEYMIATGIHPRGLVTMFETLIAERNRTPGSVEQWFSTHPLTEDRIAQISASLDAIPASRLNNLATNSQAYQEFRQRVRQLPAARQ
ncbi:MAG: M48 family metalloprotease [Gemmatimonadetes bacterium]|nr:M48 family metalloprotease [Gemmatimonadota bacterium]